MSTLSIKQRLAVCSWSLQPENPQTLVHQLLELSIPRVQCALDPIREKPEVWEGFSKLCAQNGITIISGMVGCIGEDYSTLESIRRTGGIVPDTTWEQNKVNMHANAEIAAKLAIKLVTFHAGFIPHEESDPDYDKLLKRVGEVADIFAGRGIELTLETGQETADTLKAMLRKLGRANVGVNFDPANLVLYDKGDPIQALRVLGQWVRQCHLKDAVRTKVPGTWGEEVVLGTGEVKWPDFFRALQEIKFNGNLNIEREAGQQRMKDIRTARQYVEALA